MLGKTKLTSYLLLVIWIVALIAMSSVISNVTKGGVETWYPTLNRSPLTPPNYVFGIVWSVLYAMIAVSGWLIWQSDAFLGLPRIKRLYIYQLLLNWSWSPLFFGYQLPGFSLLCIMAIILLVALLIVQAYQRLKVAALFLVPYWLWSLFAVYLNAYIWLYN